jgi:lipopolysaccharide/colanic/teichoic acid biosynthesis glycosyltransferase
MSQASVPQRVAVSGVRVDRRQVVEPRRRGAALHAEAWAGGRVGRALKRLLDVTGALIGLALVGLPVILIALLFKLCGRGLELRAETRLGLGGRPFRAYRLRAGHGRWAGWWRHLGLDRSPWLLSVLRGEMSLVGPWPVRVESQEAVPDETLHPERLRVRPGLCGWAQINGISRHAPAALSLEFDLYYVRHWSLWLDLFILAVAPFRLFLREHAF